MSTPIRSSATARVGGGLIAAVVIGALAVFFASDSLLSLFAQATIFAILALGVGVLLRQNGLVSFGHAAFYGVAGYVIGILMNNLGWSPEVAVIAAILGVSLFAFLLGFVVVRVPGIAFGMLTIAVGQSFYQAATTSRSLTGGADGLYIEWPSTIFGLSTDALVQPASMFILCWAALVLCIAVLTLLLSTRFGSVTEAVRDNEERARFIGIRTLLPRVIIFAISAMVTSVAGTLAAFNTGFISPESLHWSVSGTALMMVVIGGFRNLWGPAVGAVVFFLARDLIGELATHWLAIFGAALIIVIVFAPEGISGALLRAWRAMRPVRKSEGSAEMRRAA